VKKIDQFEDVPYVSVDGAPFLVSFVLLREEIFDVFGSFDDAVYYVDEVNLRLISWSAFGLHFYEDEVQQASVDWVSQNEKALLALAADLSQARQEKRAENR